MDRQLLERLIGAGVLVVALVVVVPAILDGDPDQVPEKLSGDEADHKPDVPVVTNEPRRTHTIRLDTSTATPPVAREITESVPDALPEEAKPPAGPEEVKPSAGPEVVKSSTGAASEPATVVSQQPVKPATEKPVVVAKAKPPSAPAPRQVKPVSTPKSGWVVQLGSFSSRQNAQRLADEVSGHGFSVFLMPLDRSGKTLYRVRVGPRESRAQAAELAGRLTKAGYSGQVTQQ